MSRPNLEANVHIGDFRIEKVLGAGGMGVVYQARQISLNRDVALKVLGSALNRDSDIVRFRREAQAVARLQHPGIAAVLFVGQDEQVCYMAMELVEGVSLRAVLDHLSESDAHQTIDSLVQSISADRVAKPLAARFDDPTAAFVESRGETALSNRNDPRVPAIAASREYQRRCCEIVRDAARALEHAHERKVVHRDVKPENLMIDLKGCVHIIDFGIARFFEDSSITETGALIGTPMYMSPEQVTGRIDVDNRTDVYSLGLVLYELLVLRRPIIGPSRDALLRRIVTKPLPPVSSRNRAVPDELQSIVHKATSKDPDARYQTAGKFAEDLQRYLDGKTILASPYRYQFDLAELVAARPKSVGFVSMVFFVQTLAAGFVCLKDFVQLYVRGDAALIPSYSLLGLVSVVALYWYYLARGLHCGKSSVNLQAMVACVPAAGVSSYVAWRAWKEYEKFENHDVSSIYFMLTAVYVIFALLSSVSLGLLARRKSRDWFSLGARLRAEHKTEGD